MIRAATALAFVASLLAIPPATAHTRSVSYSSWTLATSGATVQVRIPLLELSRLALDPVFDVGNGGRAAVYLAERISLRAGDERCEPTEPATVPVTSTAPRDLVSRYWIWIALPVVLVVGFAAGVGFVDYRIRKRYGGFRI